MTKEEKKASIVRAINRVIKRHGIMNMFKQDIWQMARMKFGDISEEIEQRLILETDAIQQYGRYEMLQTMWQLVEELKKHDINICLTFRDGYNVSLVCYLLGISTFNPMAHSNLSTEPYVMSSFKSSSYIAFKIDKNRLEVIDRFLNSQRYQVERNDIPGAYHSRRIKANVEGLSDFTLEFKYVPNIGRIRIIGELIGWDKFEKIPVDDEETMSLIHNIDIYGTTTSCISPITIEAIREIKPSNVCELADAMSFTHENKYSYLQMYLRNRDVGNKVFTGYPEIDEILSPTNGIILYTSQMGEILKMPLSSELGEAGYNALREKYISLMASPLVNKCDLYVKAYNLYRLAYIKVHFPNEFKEILK